MMVAAGPVWRGQHGGKEPLALKATLLQGYCYRAAAVGRRPGQPVHLALRGPDGELVRVAEGPGPLVMAAKDPLCVRESALYSLMLRIPRGGPYWAQLLRSR